MEGDFLQNTEQVGLFGVTKEGVRGWLLDDLVKPITHGSKSRGALSLASESADGSLIGGLLAKLDIPSCHKSGLFFFGDKINCRAGGGDIIVPIFATTSRWSTGSSGCCR
jgi:hypothetical protein